MEEKRGVFVTLVGKPVEKRPLGGPRRRWEDNIAVDSGGKKKSFRKEWFGFIWLGIGTSGGLL
jgi:hypothetical protein